MPPQGTLLNELPDRFAYQVGEYLDYQVSWSGIPAGRATMAVETRSRPGQAQRVALVSTTRSNRAVSIFYKIRDRLVSVLDPVTGLPQSIHIDQRHGRRKRIRNTTFDRQANTATTLQPGRDPVTVPIAPNIHDSLSCLYYLRGMDDLVVGSTKVIDVHEGKKNWRLLVHVLGRETVDTAAGRFDTLQVKAEVRFEGVFFDRGDVRIWMTDDPRHIPVKIRIKIRVGAVSAELRHYRTGLETVDATPPSAGASTL